MSVIAADIKEVADAGAHGVVIGFLTVDGRIDVTVTSAMVSLSHSLNLTFTFHRAIDLVIDLSQAVEDVVLCGADRILTSGGGNSALEGAAAIKVGAFCCSCC